MIDMMAQISPPRVPNVTTLEVVLPVFCALLLFGLGQMGWNISRLFTAQKEQTKAINGINVTMAEMKGVLSALPLPKMDSSIESNRHNITVVAEKQVILETRMDGVASQIAEIKTNCRSLHNGNGEKGNGI